jgi:hypothetical protein
MWLTKICTNLEGLIFHKFVKQMTRICNKLLLICMCKIGKIVFGTIGTGIEEFPIQNNTFFLLPIFNSTLPLKTWLGAYATMCWGQQIRSGWCRGLRDAGLHRQTKLRQVRRRRSRSSFLWNSQSYNRVPQYILMLSLATFCTPPLKKCCQNKFLKDIIPHRC